MSVSYQIRKTLIEQNISVKMNDSLGSVLELNDFTEATGLCKLLNINSDNSKYTLIKIKY